MPKRTKAQIGKSARAKGLEFERLIVNMLREVFDPESLVLATKAARGKEKRDLQKRSSVYRGAQGAAAREPDVVTPSRWWIETTTGTTPISQKMNQAVRDTAVRSQAGRADMVCPVVIRRAKGSRTITATMRLEDICGGPRKVAEWVVVTMDVAAFIRLLESEVNDGR